MLQTRPLRIVIPGGSGHLGRILAHHFQQRGHHVTVLTRGPYSATWNTFYWDGEEQADWTDHIERADVCINLAGRSVNCRYTAENRDAIYHSRIHTTQLLGRVIAGLTDPPKVWLNASTATIYRHAINKDMDEFTGEFGGHEALAAGNRAPENSLDSWDFSIKVAVDWEAAFFSAFTPKTRKIAMRTAVVMSPEPGGALAVLLNLVRLSLGGRQGDGRQFVSWVHALDFASAVEFLIDREDVDGPVNIAAPHPLPNHEFMTVLREAYGMPNGFSLPAPLLELGALFLRTESELVLKSRRVVPGRLLKAGFDFEFSNWADAANDLVRQWRERP